MMNLIKNQKTNWKYISIVVILSIVVCGAIYLFPMPATIITPGVKLTPIIEKFEPSLPTNKTVVIVIETSAYSHLSLEIRRYAQDVVGEMGVQVFLASFPGSVKPLYIKTFIRGVEKQNKIIGVVLVGNLPTGYYNDTFSGKSPTDFYYLDYKAQEYKCISGDTPFDTNYCVPEFWIGRITPPVASKEGISLLKDYFDRNHAYRTGKLSYERKAFFFIPMMLYVDRNSWLENKKSLLNGVTSLLVYNTNDLLYIEPTAKENYLETLSTKTYEFAYYNGHGSSNAMQAGGEANMYNDSIVIKNAKAQALFYYMGSCSTGDFTAPDYIGGWFIFGGKGLIAEAFTRPIFENVAIAPTETLFLLSRGLTFGDAFLLGSTHATHPARVTIGDPTLRLRYDEIRSEDPIVSFNKPSIDFGTGKADTIFKASVKLTNLKNTSIYLPLCAKIVWDENIGASGSGGICDTLISAGSSIEMQFEYRFVSYNVTMGREVLSKPGRYTGELLMFFNENNPIARLPVYMNIND